MRRGGRVRREEKRIGKGKDKKEYKRAPCLVTRFSVEHCAKLSLDLTKSLFLKAQQHLNLTALKLNSI